MFKLQSHGWQLHPSPARIDQPLISSSPCPAESPRFSHWFLRLFAHRLRSSSFNPQSKITIRVLQYSLSLIYRGAMDFAIVLPLLILAPGMSSSTSSPSSTFGKLLVSLSFSCTLETRLEFILIFPFKISISHGRLLVHRSLMSHEQWGVRIRIVTVVIPDGQIPSLLSLTWKTVAGCLIVNQPCHLWEEEDNW